ncbi:MAG: hypothetical protein JHC55_14955 [Mycolicibacterium sp.]|nr:hypothetical protein [Mycolicibacterium sp.]
MATDARFNVPASLEALVGLYQAKEQGGVRYRLPSWTKALDGVPGDPLRLLADSGVTAESSNKTYAARGDRVATREAVTTACAETDLDDDAAVIAAFVLVMAWGSGTSNGRSLRNTRNALSDPAAAADELRAAALTLRSTPDIDDAGVLEAHRRFSLSGVGEPFFTKWFAFAGVVPDRDWQPLILDSRVRATLNKTLDVWLNKLSDVRRDPERYVAYLTALHRWPEQLPMPVTPERLEWILFTHAGKPV